MLKKITAMLLLLPLAAHAQSDLKDLIAQGRNNSAQFTGELNELLRSEGYRRHVEQFKDDPTIRAAAEGRQIEIERIPAGSTPDKEAMKAAGVHTFVFISKSIPEHHLLSLLRERDDKTVFLMNGYGDGQTMKDMWNWIADINRKAGIRDNFPNIAIYPQLFDGYKIKNVPAVAHMEGNNWYLVQGGLSLETAKQAVKDKKFDEPVSRQWPVAEENQARVDEREWDRNYNPQEQDRLAAEAVKKTFEGSLNIPWARESRTYHFNPVHVMTYDIQNHEGKILIPKGTRINPLAADPKGRRMFVFIDGRDPWQARFARALREKRPDAIVMYSRMGGIDFPAYVLDKQMQQKMQIKEVPAVYIQNGTVFTVKTFARGQ